MHATFPRVRELLKEEVKKLGSVNKVSIKTGLTNNTIGKYLEGMSEPKQETLDKLSIYFKKPVAWLRGDTDDATPSAVTAAPVEMSREDAELCSALDLLRSLPPARRKIVTDLLESLVATS